MTPATDAETALLTADEARRAVAEAARLYFESRRARVDGFVARRFSVRGALALHRKALGLDLLRAPLNVLLAVPAAAAKLAAAAAHALGAERLAGSLASRRILLRTAVERELEWLIVTDLLELPCRQDDRISGKDALTDAILSRPQVRAALGGALEAAGRRGDLESGDLGLAMAGFAGRRAMAGGIVTTLAMLGAGAATVKQVTPGALVLGPALAGALAYQAAVAAFPLGAALGGLWYALFPVAVPPALIAGVTAGLMAAGAVATTFAGVLADPIQRRLGLHRRRLLRLIDELEHRFHENDAGPAIRERYVAWLLSVQALLAEGGRGAGPPDRPSA